MESVRSAEHPWGRWKYNARMQRPWALQASAIAIGILRDLGELDRVPSEHKQQAIAFFQSCQEPQSGLFRDPLEDDATHRGPHTWQQVWGQRHGAALKAVELLGAQPLHPLPAAQFVDLRHVDGRSFTLEQIDWRNPWGHGESWARAIRAYLRHLPASDHHDRHPVLADAFAAIESEILDPRTGMPSRRMPDENPSVAMAGLFKVMMAYLAVRRPVPHACEAIDFTLKLQKPDGEFGCGRNMCINWDALWVLRELDKQLGGTYRNEEIVASGIALADHLLQHYLKPDGGFAFHGERCMTNHHSIQLCPDGHYPIGDMLGSMMCLQCLIYVDEWLTAAPVSVQPTPGVRN